MENKFLDISSSKSQDGVDPQGNIHKSGVRQVRDEQAIKTEEYSAQRSQWKAQAGQLAAAAKIEEEGKKELEIAKSFVPAKKIENQKYVATQVEKKPICSKKEYVPSGLGSYFTGNIVDVDTDENGSTLIRLENKNFFANVTHFEPTVLVIMKIGSKVTAVGRSQNGKNFGEAYKVW